MASFSRDQRQPRPHALDEPGIQFRGLSSQQTRLDLHAGLTQSLRPAAFDQWVRVPDRIDHPRYAGLDQGLAAGRSAAMMIAGLERHIGSSPGCEARAARIIRHLRLKIGERRGLRMRAAGALMPPFGQHPPRSHQYTAHARIRVRRGKAICGQPQRSRHEGMIDCIKAVHLRALGGISLVNSGN